MSNESEKPTRKKKNISLPFLILVGVLGIAAFPVGKWVMMKVMVMQENAKIEAGPIAPSIEDVRAAGTPSLASSPTGRSRGESQDESTTEDNSDSNESSND